MSEDIQKHVRTYMIVFSILMVLTFVTVAVSYLHLPVRTAILLALIIASIKGGLVACFFMHLISEKKAVYSLLVLTFFFFMVLLLLPTVESIDIINPVLN